jgi:signal transduction histidine kinase/response regulator of citrate/malate metabolism
MKAPAAQSPSASAWLQGGGVLGALMRSTDWAATPLGPVDAWPQSLRSAVSICLGSRFPIVILWGPEYVTLYNDGYAPMLGAKHPAALGRSLRETWAEIWDVIGPMLDGVRRTGEATWSADERLILERNGFPEECYFSFSFGPARVEDGTVGGIFTAVMETTGRVVGERRLRLLKDLGAATTQAVDTADACARAARAIATAPEDLPFVGIYLSAADGKLVAQTPSASALGLPVRIGGPDDGLPEKSGVLTVPIAASGQELPMGWLVAGLNVRRPLDDDYRSFVALVAGQLASAITDARALEAERARAESLAELDRSKTTFFSNVSHEFRTPLTLMLGPLEDALAAPADTPPSPEALRLVHRNAVRLLKLVNTLLDFSRIEAGRLEARYRPTPLAELTADLASVFRSAIERAGLRFFVQCDTPREPVYVDPDLWEKIVLNLLSNAFKYTLEGEIHLTLSDAGTGIHLTVRDTGVGIDPAALPRIFERFQRIEGTVGRTQEGSGIGLALVQELVKLHGGSLDVSSDVGCGTAFVVTLPYGHAHLDPAHVDPGRGRGTGTAAVQPFVDEAMRWLDNLAPAPQARAPEAPARLPEFGDARVVVADDNADMRAYLSRLLGHRYRLEVVSDGQRALDAVHRERPDLVIADVMMPGVDGFELLSRLRAAPETRTVPVLILSARAGEESRLDGLSRGADDYVIKPFSARDLLTRIELLLLRGRVRAAGERERHRLLDLFEQAPAAIAILSGPSHVFEFANPAYLDLVGPRPILGRPIRDALPELRDQGIYEQLDAVYASGRAHRERSRHVSLVRSVSEAPVDVYFDFVYQPIRAMSGAVEGIAVIAFDVTNLAEAKRDAEAANRAKDEFLAVLGHELRNPLAPIVTALQLMTLRGDDTALKERAVIDRQVRHLVRLVDDLLDVSRIARGKVALRREPFELAEIVARAIEMASPLLEERQQNLSVRVPRSGLAVSGDLTRLAQVVLNLVTNAAKYTEPRGRIEVCASAHDGQAVLRVLDSGVGISPDMLPRVFDLFAQEAQTFERSRGGLGLGLTIVRSLVELHGGTVEVQSEGLGRGSTFTVRLPLLEALTAPQPVRRVGSVHRVPPAHRLRVLVVDDNADAAHLIAEVLALGGHTAHVALDAAAALKAADEFAPHVALLDLGLPVMNGYELATRLREACPGSMPVVIAITGYGQEEDRRRTERAGFRSHLVKPIDLEELQHLLEGLASTELSAALN